MVPVRQCAFGTVESGSLTDAVRVELPDRHLWLYPEQGAVVRVETEMKPSETFLGSGRVISAPPCGCETCLAAKGTIDSETASADREP